MCILASQESGRQQTSDDALLHGQAGSSAFGISKPQKMHKGKFVTHRNHKYATCIDGTVMNGCYKGTWGTRTCERLGLLWTVSETA